MDIHIIGGGALGCSAALALVEDGHDVTLHEQTQLGAGATHKAAGILSTFTWSPDEYRLIAETRGMVGELIALAMCEGAANARDAWRPEESILLGGPEQRAQLDLVQRVVEDATEEPERLDAGHIAREFPLLQVAADEEALVAQEDGVLDAGALMDTLATRMEGEGVRVKIGAASIAETQQAGADATVVAGGAWTRGVLAAAGWTPPVQAFRTQLASMELDERVPILHDLRQGFYMRPESDASFLAGDGTRLEDHDPESYDTSGGPQFKQDIAYAVSQRLRRAADVRLRTSWAGLCVGTPDRHPMCGAVPGADNLFVLTGDNGFGLMRSLALGVRLAEAVDGAGAAWLNPGRFGAMGPQDFQMREGFGDLSG